MKKTLKVSVGSKNPVKIEAARLAFEKVFPEIKWEVAGVDVPSGVSDQPMSDAESIKGATNRAKRALKKLKTDYGVGLEGGLNQINNDWFDCGWAVIVDKKGNRGIGSTARIQTPPSMMKLIHDGLELGVVNDIIFKKTNTKHGDGHFGLMTKNAITRTSGYRDGVFMALARFIHPNLFED